MLSLIVQVLLSLIRLQQSDQMVQAVCSGVFVHVLCPQCLHTHIISICMARDRNKHTTRVCGGSEADGCTCTQERNNLYSMLHGDIAVSCWPGCLPDPSVKKWSKCK